MPEGFPHFIMSNHFNLSQKNQDDIHLTPSKTECVKSILHELPQRRCFGEILSNHSIVPRSYRWF